MDKKLLRLIDKRGIAIEGGVGLSRRFGGGVVFGRDVGRGEPLGLVFDPVERLVPGVRKLEETVGPVLE